MSQLSRKFVAVLMLLWLTVFTGSALAASVSILMPHDSCHEVAASQSMHDMDMGEHHQHTGETPTTGSGSPSSCGTSAVCHMACAAYLAVPSVELTVTPTVASDITPYLVSFVSLTFAPLVPPPLVRV
jgi:hypothetical protein